MASWLDFEAASGRGDVDTARDLAVQLFGDDRLRALIELAAIAFVGLERQPSAAEQTAERMAPLFARLELRALFGLDRAMREPRAAHAQLSQWNAPRLMSLSVTGFPLFALASMSRSGYTREIAVDAVARHRTPRATAVLVPRLNDFVAPVRIAAERALEARLSTSALWVEALPLLDRLADMRRGAHATLPARVNAIVDDKTLFAGLAHKDAAVRRACIVRLLRRRAGDASILDVIGMGLAEKSPRVRRMVAAYAMNHKVTPRPVLEQLLPRLEVDKSPTVRGMALKTHARMDDDDPREPLLRGAFDANAAVRFIARAGLARHGGPIDLRARALRILAHDESSERERVGALAILADLGRREDVEHVVGLVGAGRVGREATRTLAILQTL